MPPHTLTSPRSLQLTGGIVGFALSGFFDGILLHQVLQWHHLFSLVPGEAWRDIRNQVLVDGLFHVLMYIIAAYGLFRLWQARQALRRPDAGRSVTGGALIGFGTWNVVDVVGFHWVIGIHRTRIDVPDPLLYDLGWLTLFALPFLVAGVLALRDSRSGPPGAAAASVLALLTPVSAAIAAMRPSGSRTAVALFAPGTPGAAMFNAATRADARILWADPATGLAAFAAERPFGSHQLYGEGALFVTRSTALAGCLAWART